MKRLYTLFFFIALAGYSRVFGQELQITPGDTFTYSGTLATITDSHEQNGYFVNNTADTTLIYWRALSATMDSAWQLSFCDPENCYYYSVGQALGNYGLNHFTAAPHVSYLLRFGVSPSCSADSGKMVVQTWLASDSAGSVQTLYYFANYTGSCATAVQNVPTASFRVYPTPVSSYLTVDGLGSLKNVKLSIFDILGNQVVQKYIAQPADQADLNTEMLHTGIYFLTIESDGAKLLTKRIEKLD